MSSLTASEWAMLYGLLPVLQARRRAGCEEARPLPTKGPIVVGPDLQPGTPCEREATPREWAATETNVVRGDRIMTDEAQVAPEDMLEWIFTYHAPTPEQAEHYVAIRDAALSFATVLHNNTPAGPDRTAAMRHLREAVMTANQGIALNGLSYR